MAEVMTEERAASLNGLPVAALERIRGSVRDAPEQGLLAFETTSRWLGGLRSRTTVNGFEAGGQRLESRHIIDADEPRELLGSDTAPNPHELFLAGIGSCLAAVYAVQATELGIELRSLEIAVRGTLDVRGVLCLADVPPGSPELDIRVFVDALASPEQIRTLHRRVLATSPSFYHLTTAIQARTQLVLVG